MLIDVAIIVLLPLLLAGAYLLGYVESVLGSSPPSHGDLDRLLERKRTTGFARLTRRTRTSHLWMAARRPTAEDLEAANDLTRLAATKRQLFRGAID
jgi:hypothetical protein